MIWIAIMDASKGEEDRLKTFENKVEVCIIFTLKTIALKLLKFYLLLPFFLN